MYIALSVGEIQDRHRQGQGVRRGKDGGENSVETDRHVDQDERLGITRDPSISKSISPL